MIENLRVKAVAFQDEGGMWIVQGVEYDICVHGESLRAARKAFERALIESCIISRHLGKEPMENFPAAPHRFHEMFEEAEDEIQQVKAPEPSAPDYDASRQRSLRMAKRVEGRWFRVLDLITLFVAMGCTLGDVPNEFWEDDDGARSPVRFLFNPETQRFVSLHGLADEDSVALWEVESWERVLGLEIPKGDGH